MTGAPGVPTRRAVIVDALRSPCGRRNGALSGWHPVDLVAACLEALVARNQGRGFDPAVVDDVIVGCVSQIGAQSANVARNAVLAAGWPEAVPGTTVERQCGSSEQALHFAAQAVMAGACDVVVAGGVEVQSLVPMAASTGRAYGAPFGPRVTRRYHDRGGLVPQGVAAEAMARHWGLGRDDLDAYAAGSQERAGRAAAGGRFDTEIVPLAARRREAPEGADAVAAAPGGLVAADECVVPTSREALAALRPLVDAGGVVTAGNSAQIADGASACLVMDEDTAARLGCMALAAVVGTAVVGTDPLLMLDGPIPATRRVLGRSGLGLADIGLVEIHESSAAVVLAWMAELGGDPAIVNVNGGAIALGHPPGASGTRQLATLVHELVRSGSRYGLSVMSGIGGTATATVLERLG
jgi:acetyl-CoA acyltransferase